MSKSRAPRLSKPAVRAIGIVLGAAIAIAASLALPHAQDGASDCSLVQARLATSEYPALDLHFCARVPVASGAAVLRYDIAVRVTVMPPRPR